MKKISKISIATAMSFWLSLTAQATIIAYDSKQTFIDATGDQLITQDWSSYEINTSLDGQLLDDIKYSSTSSEELVVGSPHGANWLLGYQRASDRYASFSGETISFEFLNEIDVFGISLSQGNQNQGERNIGSTVWSVVLDEETEYFSRVDYDLSDFSGEAFLGLNGLNGVSRIDVRRISSAANITWNMREIYFENSSSVPVPVPEPASLWLFGSGLVGLLVIARVRKHASKSSALLPKTSFTM